MNENNNYKYNSKELDSSTGLLYYGARYYDSKIGRFTTPDPVSGSIINPQSLNKYVYVQNNPMKYVDPSGNIGLDANFRYSVYASNQFTPPYYTFSYGAGFKNVFNNDKRYGISNEVNFDFIASGGNTIERLIHPIYGAFNLDLSKNTPIGKIALEHTSFHTFSLGTTLSVQLKDFPLVNERTVTYDRYFPDLNPEAKLIEDMVFYTKEERLNYFGQTNLITLTQAWSGLETSIGIGEIGYFSTINTLLDLAGPPIFTGARDYISGGFGRIKIPLEKEGTVNFAGITNSKNSIFGAGFKSQHFSAWDNNKFFISVYANNKGNYGLGVTLISD